MCQLLKSDLRTLRAAVLTLHSVQLSTFIFLFPPCGSSESLSPSLTVRLRFVDVAVARPLSPPARLRSGLDCLCACGYSSGLRASGLPWTVVAELKFGPGCW